MIFSPHFTSFKKYKYIFIFYNRTVVQFLVAIFALFIGFAKLLHFFVVTIIQIKINEDSINYASLTK